ncbi:MAG: hypothetical protein LBV09_00805 [Deferribacteraceae bacterium]|jgi:hypothetical protein|nr:hypothetical protein [Deferribacteraceae bacterium]
MDKSEGTDFFSRTFSSLSERLARLYYTGHKKVSISSLKRVKHEKLAVLGNKVFTLMQSGKKLNAEELTAEYAAIMEVNDLIVNAEGDLADLNGNGTPEPEIEMVVAEEVVVEKKKPAAKKAAPKKEVAKKEAPKKAAAKSTAKKDEKPKRKYTRKEAAPVSAPVVEEAPAEVVVAEEKPADTTEA